MIRRATLGVVLLLAATAALGDAVHAGEREEAIVAAMSLPAEELARAIETSRWRDDPLFLAAVAQNPAAPSRMLDDIARRPERALHERLYGSERLLGRNRKGLAVMRLVVLHPHVTEATLMHLANSHNEYVIGTVLGNAKTPEAVLRRFAGSDNDLYHWGLAQNPRTPVDLLVPLASSANEYTRGMVAANPATPVDVLAQLAADREWHVRRGVAMNPSAPRELVERLAGDGDERVRRGVEAARIRRGGPAK